MATAAKKSTRSGCQLVVADQEVIGAELTHIGIGYIPYDCGAKRVSVHFDASLKCILTGMTTQHLFQIM